MTGIDLTQGAEGLSDKHKLFCEEYLRTGYSGAKAARLAGYEGDNVNVIACQLLQRDDVKAYLESLKGQLAKVIGVSLESIALELKRIAFADVSDFLDSSGNLKPIDKLEPGATAAISSFERGKRSGDKIRLHNKVNALTEIAKLMGVDKPIKIAQTDKDGNDVVLDAPRVMLYDDMVKDAMERLKKEK